MVAEKLKYAWINFMVRSLNKSAVALATANFYLCAKRRFENKHTSTGAAFQAKMAGTRLQLTIYKMNLLRNLKTVLLRNLKTVLLRNLKTVLLRNLKTVLLRNLKTVLLRNLKTVLLRNLKTVAPA